jgi:copine 1/2/3
MNPTITSIVNSSHLPMSIIIIGVGKEDFTQMEILDGDNGLVDSNCNNKNKLKLKKMNK